MYYLDNGQRCYKPQTKHVDRVILPSSSQKYLWAYLWVPGSRETDRRKCQITTSSFFLLRHHFEQETKGQGSDMYYCTCAVHMQKHFTTLCLWWLRSRCLQNLSQSNIWWLTTAWRNFYQPVLVRIHCDSAIMEAWLPFHDVLWGNHLLALRAWKFLTATLKCICNNQL